MSQSIITKSVRLSINESNEIAQLSHDTTISESALMKKWVLEGIRVEKLDRAILAYSKNQVDLRTGAAMAGVPYHQFVREVENRNIMILEDENFLDGLLSLADAFDMADLRRATEKVIASQRRGESV